MKFYRYEAVQYASMNSSDGEYTNSIHPNPTLELREYNLYKETNKGYWIGYGYFGIPDKLRGNAHWVSKTGKKRFAYPTKKEALIGYIKRTERRIKILTYQLDSCKISLSTAGRKLDALNILQP